MNCAARLIVEKGGTVEKGYNKDGYIVNRTLRGKIRELEKVIETSRPIYHEKGIEIEEKEYFAKLIRELSDLKTIKNDPVPVRYLTYIRFSINNHNYYYQLETNPFFDFFYITDSERNAVIDKKEWVEDCLFSVCASDEDIERCARGLLSQFNI